MTRSEFAAAIRAKYMLNELLDTRHQYEVYDALFHSGCKLLEYFGNHDRICISVSGGSDSDCIVHLVCTYFPEFLEKCRFVFVNTGLEYDATKRHLCDLENRYGITIDRIRGISVVTAIRKYGIPILNKSRSHDIYYYMLDKKWAVDRIDGGSRIGTRYEYSTNMISMIHFAKQNGIKISAHCCDKSKKEPIKRYIKDNGLDLNVTGERKAEGGQRASSHKSCFEQHKDGIHKYMPLWWWSNEIKQIFKVIEGIRYSDCYEVYGMKRTGCCGCPFNLNIANDLQLMFLYEPRLFNACMRVFGESYSLTDKFNCRSKKCLPEFYQLSLF